MLTLILEDNGKNPGFLIGGIPENFGISARSTDSEYFVIEADEYDCAFFDKRSKFVHYHPTVLIMNNLEYDHADIVQPSLVSGTGVLTSISFSVYSVRFLAKAT